MSKSIDLETITAEEYAQYVKDNERDSYHCVVEHKQFDSNTGERISHPELVKFSRNEFNTMKHNLLLMGYTVDVLHDPAKAGEQPKAEAVEKRPVGRPRNVEK